VKSTMRCAHDRAQIPLVPDGSGLFPEAFDVRAF
jgi:hypothetical protein